MMQPDFGPNYRNNFEEKVLSRTLVLTSGSPNSFTIQLPTRIYNVLGIKLHAIEFLGDVGRMINADGSFKPLNIFINDFNQVISNNVNADGAFARVFAHTAASSHYIKFYSNHSSNPFDDVYSYLFNPNSTSIDRFLVNIRDDDGDAIFESSDNVKVTVSLLIYYRFSKGNI